MKILEIYETIILIFSICFRESFADQDERMAREIQEWSSGTDCVHSQGGVRYKSFTVFHTLTYLHEEDGLKECIKNCKDYYLCKSLNYGKQGDHFICELSEADSSLILDKSILVEDGDFTAYDILQNCDPKIHDDGPVNFPTSKQKKSLPQNECFHLQFATRRMSENLIRTYKYSVSLKDCQESCEQEMDFICRGFAYKYPKGLTDSLSSNCHLTDRDLTLLDKFDLSSDLIADSVTDIYARENSLHCRRSLITNKDVPFVQIMRTSNIDSCYKTVRENTKHYVYRDYTSVDTPEQCHIRCKALGYCMTFSFRLDSKVNNCLLSHLLSHELEERDLIFFKGNEDETWTIYALNPDNRKCQNSLERRESDQPMVKAPECYQKILSQFKIQEDDVVESIKANDLEDCSKACHENNRCMTFSFSKLALKARFVNCILSGAKLSRNEDPKEKHFDWNTYEIVHSGQPFCTSFQFSKPQSRPGCFTRVRFGTWIESNNVSITVKDINECLLSCIQDPFCATVSFRFRNGINCALSDQQVETLDSTFGLTSENEAELFRFHTDCSSSTNTGNLTQKVQFTDFIVRSPRARVKY